MAARMSTDSSASRGRKVTPPSPSYMSQDQFANYLSGLRSNKTVRPGGARPQANSRASTGHYSLDAAPSLQSAPAQPGGSSSRPPSAAAASVSSRLSSATIPRGRDYYPCKPTVPLKPSQVVPTATYMERGQRWMEKEEAVSLRDAMQELDMRDAKDKPAANEDESRLYHAALNEASELVWQHEHPGAIARPDGPYRYRPHLRKNSYAHARSASIGDQADLIAPSGLGRDIGSRSVSRCSTDSDSSNTRSVGQSVDQNPSAQPYTNGRRGKAYGPVGAGKRRTSLRRSVTGQVERPFSGDQIWEEPEAGSASSVGQGASAAKAPGRVSPVKLGSKPQGPLNRNRVAGPRQDEARVPKPFNRFEIHRNAPSQSRNPLYTTNTSESRPVPQDASVQRKNGVEVRNEEIRAATSRRLKDRSAKLPEPTAVSDSPGRPIVSFDANWKAPDESADGSPERPAQSPSTAALPVARWQVDQSPVETPGISVATDDGAAPSQQATRPLLPSIAIDEAADGPAVPSVSVPSIVTPHDEARARQLPSVRDATGSPRAKPQGQRGHWSPAPGTAPRRTTACCHECNLAIEGRFVSLAGGSERFHPHCFRCFSCGTKLEAMEISPEPDHVRNSRLERIRRRANGETLDDDYGISAADDGDERLRFYCHLDWHEKFAPRCKHCKTPILGEHIVALGAHWHYGHFFCAECGDPFEHGMTHIEKDGYAWCVACQTKRTERRAPKCKLCKTAVIGQYIVALGGEWHEHCFRCADCGGGFDDGQIFPREAHGSLAVLCTACRTRELKA
ncbi:hypothetical protein CDD81_525 [Ophiocordyceps australis]|uniref:LIM zinc-binding domain-containing protein n=1 Tax=Ophiocordyceps australis TaxID=1399860 RepID=A0A2C5XVJ7_9HYPO|nr:hypothetical protein CDD81_525 [Ophiocordyceps australis]